MTGRTQGGSTLTQQTLKEVYFKRTNVLVRKALAEPVLAPLLELNLSKEDILYVYLNRVYFGGSAYGIEAAARVYFAESARDLTIARIRRPRFPAARTESVNPHRNPDRRVRARTPGDRPDGGAGPPLHTEADAAKGQRLAVAPSRSAWGGSLPGGTQGGWFAPDGLKRRPTKRPGEHSGTRTIQTTLNSRIQKAAERHLGGALDRHGGSPGIEEGAVVVMRPGRCGGRHGGRAGLPGEGVEPRHPGAAAARLVAKLFVYLAALERGLTRRAG